MSGDDGIELNTNDDDTAAVAPQPFDPSVAIDESTVPSLTIPQIDARLQELIKGSPLTVEQSNEELQLKLWKLQAENDVLVRNKATAKEIDDKKIEIDKAIASLTAAKQKPWNFVPPSLKTSQAASNAPGGQVKHEDKNPFEDISGNPFDLKSHTIMGQMFEAAGIYLGLLPVQFVIDYIIARPAGVINSMVKGALFTAFGATVKLGTIGVQTVVGVPYRLVTGNRFSMDTAHQFADSMITKGETYTGTYALMYKPLLTYPISAFGAFQLWRSGGDVNSSLFRSGQHYLKVGQEYRDGDVLFAHLLNHDVAKVVAVAMPTIGPNLLKITYNSLWTIPDAVISAGYNFRASYLAKDEAEVNRLRGLAKGWTESYKSRVKTATGTFFNVALHPFSQGLAPMTLPSGAKLARDDFYDAMAPFAPMFAFNHNYPRWVEATNLRTAGANNQPTASSEMGYFLHRRNKTDAIMKALSDIEGSLPPGSAEKQAAKQMLDTIKGMKNNPPIENLANFFESLKAVPGESDVDRVNRIAGVFADQKLNDPKVNYFKQRSDKIGEINNRIDAISKELSKDPSKAPMIKQLNALKKQITGVRVNPSLEGMENLLNNLNVMDPGTMTSKDIDGAKIELDGLLNGIAANGDPRRSATDHFLLFAVFFPVLIPLGILNLGWRGINYAIGRKSTSATPKQVAPTSSTTPAQSTTAPMSSVSPNPAPQPGAAITIQPAATSVAPTAQQKAVVAQAAAAAVATRAPGVTIKQAAAAQSTTAVINVQEATEQPTAAAAAEQPTAAAEQPTAAAEQPTAAAEQPLTGTIRIQEANSIRPSLADGLREAISSLRSLMGYGAKSELTNDSNPGARRPLVSWALAYLGLYKAPKIEASPAVAPATPNPVVVAPATPNANATASPAVAQVTPDANAPLPPSSAPTNTGA